MSVEIGRRFVVFSFLSLIFFQVAQQAQARTVKDIRMWTAPDHTRLVLDLDGEVEYRLFRLQDPARVVVDLEGTRSRAGVEDLDLPDPVLKGVRTGYPEEGTFRVVAYGQMTQIFGAVPLLGGLIGSLWYVVVLVVGLREIHETSYARVILAFVLMMVLAVAVLLAVMIPVMISLFR